MIDQTPSQLTYTIDLLDQSRLRVVPSRSSSLDLGVAHSKQPSLGFSAKLAKNLLQGQVCWSLVRERLGRQCVVGVCASAQGRFGRSLYVSLFIDQGELESIWPAIDQLAARMAVTDLVVERFSRTSQDDTLPRLLGEEKRYRNVKLYVWNLEGGDWDVDMSSNHKRNIARARKAGVEAVVLPRNEAFQAHLKLIESSLKRRAERGEPTSLASDAKEVDEILSTGQAQLYQAAIDGAVVSSKIAFVLDRFGYYDSGGTSEHGMKMGASHYLMHSIASSLRQRGVVSLNLDVASAAAGGLARYKADFGASEWFVNRVTAKQGSVSRMLKNAWRSLATRTRA